MKVLFAIVVLSIICVQLSSALACSVSPAQLKAMIRSTNRLRAQCESALAFDDAYCSNYWAELDEMRILSSSFQECLENSAAALRKFIYGDPQTQTPAAFVGQGALDRAEVDYDRNQLLALLKSSFVNTTNLQTNLFRSNLQSFINNHTSSTATSVLSVQTNSESTRTLTHNEESNTRGLVNTVSSLQRTLNNAEETNTRGVFRSESSTIQTKVSDAASSVRANNVAEDIITSQREHNQTSATQSTDSTEEKNNRLTEGIESNATRAFHTATLLTTKNTIVAEIDTVYLGNRGDESNAASSLRGSVDSDGAKTKTTTAQEGSTTSSTVSSTISGETPKEVQSATNAASVEQNLVTSSANATNARVHAEEITTASLFLNSAIPSILAGNDLLDAQMINVFLHLNLANCGYSWWKRFALVELFSRPENGYFDQTRSLINNTVSYCTSHYPNGCGNAYTFWQYGEQRVTVQDYRGAMGYYRKAYSEATK